MKFTAALLASVVLSASTLASHASTIAPGISLDLVNGTTNYSFLQIAPGTFVAADGLNSVTAVYLGTGLVDTFAVTEVCVSVGFVRCKGYTLTIADANAAAVSVGLGLSAAALANTTLSTNLATLHVDGSLGAGVETIAFALPASASPVPEPGTLGLMATGLVGAAGAVRRQFQV